MYRTTSQHHIQKQTSYCNNAFTLSLYLSRCNWSMYCVFSTCLLASIQRSNLCALCWVIFMCIYYNIYIYIHSMYICVYIYILVGGFNPFEKYESQLRLLYIHKKNGKKPVPNHQYIPFPTHRNAWWFLRQKAVRISIQAADPVFRWHQILQVVIFASAGARNAWIMISVACAKAKKTKRKLCELENSWYLCCMFNWLTACQLQLYNYPWRLIVRGWNAHDTIWWLPSVASNHSQNISQLGSSS